MYSWLVVVFASSLVAAQLAPPSVPRSKVQFLVVDTEGRGLPYGVYSLTTLDGQRRWSGARTATAVEIRPGRWRYDLRRTDAETAELSAVTGIVHVWQSEHFVVVTAPGLDEDEPAPLRGTFQDRWGRQALWGRLTGLVANVSEDFRVRENGTFAVRQIKGTAILSFFSAGGHICTTTMLLPRRDGKPVTFSCD